MNPNRQAIVRFGEIQEMVKSYHPDADLDLIRAAYIYSAQVHVNQKRKSGEPYLVHPVAVAGILAEMKLDEASIATGFLHDSVEDTLTSIEDLERFFGKEVATLVDGVTKISKMEFQSKEHRQAESFRKMILAMSRDIRVLLVKLADRLHNMRTLDPMPEEARRRIARETMEIYGPLAGRIGVYWIRTELEELAFRHLEPEKFADLKARVEQSLRKDEEYRERILSIIEKTLKEYKIRAVTKGRTKDISSINRKMINQNISFEQVHDLTAFRIILNDVNQCYAVLGLIHSLWRPVPGRFKDYIAMPKSNGYQSLHTTVIGPDGRRIEIQIRSHEMDLIAEHGIAAHWSYKEGNAVDLRDAKVVGWLRQVMEWQQDLDDPREFLDNVRVDLYPDQVHVFTPAGDVKEFPKGATPLDFAYSIHTEVGHHCMGARVNGKMVPLKYQLKTGEMVEITTSSHQKPSKDWLKFVKTGRARTKIRHFVMNAERERAIEIGKDTTDRELRRWKLDLGAAEKSGEILKIAEEHSLRTETDFYAAIGYGRISPKVVITKLVPPEEREQAKAALHSEKLVRKMRSRTKSGVRVQGLSDLMINFAKCCNPLPGDAIKGFITRGRGVTVHKADCNNLKASDRQRLVDVDWDEDQPLPRKVRLGIDAKNKMGLLATISGVFTSNDSDIAEAKIAAGDSDMARGTFSVYVKNLEHLDRIIKALRAVKEVERVERLGM